ncbi:uncharacterized protein LOC109609286 [Aethina tumida]|uniref:uncharacterized protein LOC109609286 n=1 Tax=Aethina tumida TaxID=116153 RepID=UPI00096B3DA3|nr:uncharacterized protein LOC109609286 [Aethina tumida]
MNKHCLVKMNSQVFIVLLLISITFAKQIVVQNKGRTPLQVSITGKDNISLLAHSIAKVDLEEGWSGSISACREVCDGPKTVAELSIGATADQYSVSLVNGFNLPIKVVPIKGRRCTAAICSAKINKLCPVENQVSNSLGVVVACKKSPAIFQKVCKKAVIVEGDILNVKTCNAQSYKVIIG